MYMCYIRQFSLVPHSVEKMFNLINDVHSYSEFIPGCDVIKILNKNHNELIAEIIPVANSIIVQSIITHNFFVKNKSIIIFLVRGPFKSFYGRWKFFPISENISRIEYISYYEFQSIILKKMCNHVFQGICNNIIKMFIARANQVYGASQ